MQNTMMVERIKNEDLGNKIKRGKEKGRKLLLHKNGLKAHRFIISLDYYLMK